MKTLGSALAAIAAVLCFGTAHAITVSDPTDWASGWAFSFVTITGVGTASIVVEGSGGNPGARVNSTTVTPGAGDFAYGTALYQAVSVAAPPSGTAFVMRIDALSGAGAFGQGQGILALVEQGGSLYGASVGITGFPLNSFTTLTFNGTFVAGNFSKLTGPGPATPTFDGSTSTRFGFAAGNAQSGTLTQYYDNWSITYALPVAGATPTNVPTLSQWTLVLLATLVAFAGLLARRHRR
jgi:hypothetical protein